MKLQEAERDAALARGRKKMSMGELKEMAMGKLYGIGVGPGDPELLTRKACRLLREADVIFCPVKEAGERSFAYEIVKEQADEGKAEIVFLVYPMHYHGERLRELWEENAKQIAARLDGGRTGVFVTLGDPAIYSTLMYTFPYVEERGIETEIVPGVPSFCAAAAKCGVSLVEWNEQLHVIPAVHRIDASLDLPGNYVLMKSGKKMGQVKELLKKSGKDVMMVENCGMESERIYRSVDEIPDDAGYYSLIIAKEGKE